MPLYKDIEKRGVDLPSVPCVVGDTLYAVRGGRYPNCPHLRFEVLEITVTSITYNICADSVQVIVYCTNGLDYDLEDFYNLVFTSKVAAEKRAATRNAIIATIWDN
jgi:hypothetical protein